MTDAERIEAERQTSATEAREDPPCLTEEPRNDRFEVQLRYLRARAEKTFAPTPEEVGAYDGR